jgi:hypothetical protein
LLLVVPRPQQADVRGLPPAGAAKGRYYFQENIVILIIKCRKLYTDKKDYFTVPSESRPIFYILWFTPQRRFDVGLFSCKCF